MYEFPQLNALRFFEAAGRHMSFTRAAQELNVTQAAVSHQIKGLEQRLGVALFRRAKRRLHLSAEGRLLLPVLRDCFERIDQTVARLAQSGQAGTLTVMLRPYFASRWLSARLYRFWRRYPDIELRLHHTAESSELSLDYVDMNVRWGDGNWSDDVESDLLLTAHLTPVCSPKLLSTGKRLSEPADILKHTMLHAGDSNSWMEWLAAAGVTPERTVSGPIIDDANVRMESVIDGQGFTLAPVPLISDDLAAGRVVAPFDTVVTERGYYIVYPTGALVRPRVKAFRDWLLEEANGAQDKRREAQ